MESSKGMFTDGLTKAVNMFFLMRNGGSYETIRDMEEIGNLNINDGCAHELKARLAASGK